MKFVALLLLLGLFQDTESFQNKPLFVFKNGLGLKRGGMVSRYHSTLERQESFTLHALQRPNSSKRNKTTKPTKYRYLRALPSTGFYSQGGIYTEYIRAMRLKSKVEIEEGFVKADRNALTSFFLAPSAINIEECIVDEDGTACKRVILRDIVPVPIRNSAAQVEPALISALSVSKIASKSKSQNMADYTTFPTTQAPMESQGIVEDGEEETTTNNFMQSINTGYSWSGGAIVDRNGGLYDNLDGILSRWVSKSFGTSLKKSIYDKMKQTKGSYASPYHLFIDVLKEVCGLAITGILIEVADSPNDASLSLGAAVMVTKIEETSDAFAVQEALQAMEDEGVQMEVDASQPMSQQLAQCIGLEDRQARARRKWILTISNYADLVKRQQKLSSPAKLVDCLLDEALGLHFATNIPIISADSLYKRISQDGILEQRYFVVPKINIIRAPYFESEADSKKWESNLEAVRARPAKEVAKVGEIQDATTFLKMKLSQKRACLRASGVRSLPRPREGPRSVDAIMIPLLDEEVAYEVLRRLGETKGDFEMAAQMEDYQTRKPELARQYNEALKAGKEELAAEIMEEFNSLGFLRYDPSNPEEEVKAKDGSESGGFDIEEWYWEQRKRVYGIIAA